MHFVTHSDSCVQNVIPDQQKLWLLCKICKTHSVRVQSISVDLLVMMHASQLSCNAASRPQCRLRKTPQFSRTDLPTCAQRPTGGRLIPQSTCVNAISACFAAAVAPELADEHAAAPSDNASNKSKKQQSSAASHVKPCYPTKTINCSDGEGPLAHLSTVCRKTRFSWHRCQTQASL